MLIPPGDPVTYPCRMSSILPDAPRFDAPVYGTIFGQDGGQDRKSTRLNSSHTVISYAVFCLKKKKSICSAIAASALIFVRRVQTSFTRCGTSSCTIYVLIHANDAQYMLIVPRPSHQLRDCCP